MGGARRSRDAAGRRAGLAATTPPRPPARGSRVAEWVGNGSHKRGRGAATGRNAERGAKGARASAAKWLRARPPR